MTSDEIKKVREAAELWKSGKGENLERFTAEALLADYILSTIPADFDQPVTENFLKEYGAEEVYNSEVPDYIFRDEHGEIRMKLYRVEDVFVCEIPEWPDDIHCRYQFRLLAAALGIKRKGE